MMLLVDISGSGSFGSQVQQKRDLIADMAATLAFSALTNNDKVGLLLFSDRVEKFIPPTKGKQNVLRIIRELIEHKQEGFGTDINLALNHLNGVLKKRAIVFLLSDFMADGYEKSFGITAKKHDFTSIRIFDTLDTTLPNVGMLPAKNPETGRMGWINTGSRAIRHKYWEIGQNQITQLKNVARKTGAGLIEVSVQDNYIHKLMAFFKSKGGRR